MNDKLREETIADMKRCIEQFRKNKLFILADMKEKDLEIFINKNGGK